MNDDIYRKLGERLNKNFMRLPLGEPVLAFLKKAFTPEQAAIGAAFPMGAHTLEDLAQALSRDPDELFAALDAMADEGLIFIHRDDTGHSLYSLPPFFPGIVEFQTMRGAENQREKEMALAVKDMMDYLEEVGKELFKKPDVANKVLPAALRTLPVETQISTDPTVMPFEQVSAMIDGETSFAAVFCHCRQQARLTGNPCKIENVPERTCFYFGAVADFMVERGFARRVSKEECLEILRQCEAAGLVHNINNYLGRSLVLCNCCSCCCDFLARMKKYRGLQSVARSNFIVRVNPDNCTGCGACVDRCQMEALTLKDDTVVWEESWCIGCGNCAAACPAGALAMVRHSTARPVEFNFPFPGLGL
ncbi:MAG: 4Fe-4S binding protein [Thermodesulfobacteriota bacterium]